MCCPAALCQGERLFISECGVQSAEWKGMAFGLVVLAQRDGTKESRKNLAELYFVLWAPTCKVLKTWQVSRNVGGIRTG